MLTRRILLTCAALLAFAGWTAVPAAAQSRSDRAAQFVSDLGSRAVEALVSPAAGRTETAARFRQLLNEGFDLPYIGRFVLGRYWQAATPEQQQEYMRLFEKMIVDVYADRFSQYSGRQMNAKETLKILGHRNEGERDAIVSTQIVRPDGPPVGVEWRLRERDGKMAIIDVAVEGVSMSVTQRNEFNSVIQRGGGKIEALLDALRQRTSRS